MASSIKTSPILQIGRPQDGSKHLTIHSEGTIENAMSVAKERYLEHAKHMDQIADVPGDSNQFISPDGARRLADQFRRQAAEVDEIIDLLMRSESIVLMNVEPEPEVDDVLKDTASPSPR